MLQTLPGSTLYVTVNTQRTALDVDGWFPEKMGMAVAAVRQQNRTCVYQEGDVHELMRTHELAELVIGYNITAFDLQLLGRYAQRVQ